ncbi:MAG: NAD-dependent epimerase [Bacteroidia bacterium]|nr:MAG: NAD-dependent epimerase [Bacteroidia bacterium]
MKILITGTAGFLGSHLAKRLLKKNYEVFGLDSINDYYDTNIKFARLAQAGIDKEEISYNKTLESRKYANYKFIKLQLEDKQNIQSLVAKFKPDVVCNLAAQAGVRYSLKNPYAYLNSNLNGFLNIIEACRQNNVKHFLYASSSSVYGLNEKLPLSVKDNVDHPISLYAATKKSNELMAHAYSYLYNIPTTGLRFFTVYGPWGRPDMALFIFTKAILEDKPIEVYNYGNMKRDFTYIDDIVAGIERMIPKPPLPNDKWTGLSPDPASSLAPYRLYNIGNNSPVNLLDFIEAIEDSLGKKAKKQLLPLQKGDVMATYADVSEIVEHFDYKPNTPIKKGISEFIKWYREYYKV